MAAIEISVHAATPERWADLEQLFGAKGACGGCWCQWWHQTPAEYDRAKGEGNRLQLKAQVETGREPGLLAYVGGKAVGWCALGPRSSYERLARTRTLKPVDDQPVWAVVCFFVARGYRRQGVSRALLEAALRHAAAHGATIVEAYPLDKPTGVSTPDVYAFPGVASMFRALGFVEAARNAPTRPIMRKAVGE